MFDHPIPVPHDRREVVIPSMDPTFGRPRAVALVDRWCVFLIDPYPKSPSTLNASADRFRRVDHTIRSHHTGVSRSTRTPLAAFTRNGSMGAPQVVGAASAGVSVGLPWVVWTVWSGLDPMDASCGGQPSGRRLGRDAQVLGYAFSW